MNDYIVTVDVVVAPYLLKWLNLYVLDGQNECIYLLAVDEIQNSCPELLFAGRSSHGGSEREARVADKTVSNLVQISYLIQRI